MRPSIIAVLIGAFSLACSGDDNNSVAASDTGTPGSDASETPDTTTPDAADPDVGVPPDTTVTPDQDPTPDTGAADAAPDMASTLQESEPNDGVTVDEIDELPLGRDLAGFVDADDSDVFAVDTEAGSLYTVELTLPADSQLEPHLTILDDGRDDDPAGGDYVKIARDTSIEFLAMGEGGHLVVVRDPRNVDGDSVGGPDHTYTLRVTASDPTETAAGEVTFGGTLNGTLSRPGDVDLWTFDGTAGMDVVFDMNAADGDGRLYVFATETGSWIARQDDRTAGDPNPLIDAPLFANGPMYLVVENIAEEATDVGYTIDARAP